MPISQRDLFASLGRAYSRDRLVTYRRPGDDDGSVLARYLWNTQLSEALYPSLQALEIGLRNSLHTAVAGVYGRLDWYDMSPSLLHTRQQDMVVEAKATLHRAGKSITPGRMVAELTFGFWTSLFNVFYETKGRADPRLWPRLLAPTFPHMPRRIRTRRTISATLTGVRHLRNRVFHHEPIWNDPSLLTHHAEVGDLIRWLNPDLFTVVALLDRFPAVYHGGEAHCRTLLAQIMIP